MIRSEFEGPLGLKPSLARTVFEGARKMSGLEISQESRENLARVNERLGTGPLVVYANHISFHDAGVSIPLVLSLPNARQILGPVGYKYYDLQRNPVMGAFLRSLPAVGIYPLPVVQENDSSSYPGEVQEKLARAYLRRTRETLDQPGTLFGIAPEGTRNSKGTLQRGHPGLGYLERLVRKHELSYVPIGFAYREHSDRPSITVGEPFTLRELLPEGFMFGEPQREHAQQRTDLLMVKLAALLPPHMRGDYSDPEQYLEPLGLQVDDIAL